MSDKRREVVEVCPYCEREVVMQWSVEDDGFKAFCPYCGERLMLCDECMHRTGEFCDDCDFSWDDDSKKNGHCRFNPRIIPTEKQFEESFSEMIKPFSELKAGDEVLVEKASCVSLHKVNNITPTGLIRIGTVLFKPTDGYPKGAWNYKLPRLIPFTYENYCKAKFINVAKRRLQKVETELRGPNELFLAETILEKTGGIKNV